MTTAIVTGGSRGIGRAIVSALAEKGVSVTFTYRSGVEEAEALQKQLKKQGRTADAVSLDVTDQEACREFINAFYKANGAPDILVNNAGVTDDSLLFAMKKGQWDKVIDTDLNGIFNMTQTTVFHMMKARKGRIINIASISGLNGIKGQCNYSAAKGAVIGFTKALAKEASPMGIAVNAIAPVGVETEMTAAISKEALEEMLREVPMKRLCTPEEVANVAAYLALESPLYLTGTSIVLDGGLGSL
ncbi:MAG: 3-oxoacyl-ACP reductase FabG [Eubacteriales bacterium]|nr:3-oxoacyl-ACP reductase FabG [Eubacteriales bacterium]